MHYKPNTSKIFCRQKNENSAAVSLVVFSNALAVFVLILDSSCVYCCARSNAFLQVSMLPNKISLFILSVAEMFSTMLLTDRAHNFAGTLGENQ
jgi:hypothetical protein